MRKLLVIVVAILYTVSCFAQEDVTKFLGFPVDGTQPEMIKNLKSKGFKLSNVNGTNILTGRFNGNDVNVYISTENGKVSRLMVCDENTMSETDIKIRFNRLCRQFKDNGKYLSLDYYTIPENEDLSYEMAIRNKRYEAIFYQLPEGEAMERLQATILEEIQSKYTPEQLESPSEDIRNEIISLSLDLMMNSLKNKPVWFMISELYGKYYITMFYDNEYNRANGEDL
ncbi:MAG: hypothetical protein K2K45_08850 [Muribaculaceae bacterium]|nr:hypothetical protein [Muribaculaceae bacterium]